MLDIRSLSVSYGQHRALEDVSIKVDPGEIVVILGANGAGKSTLLSTVGGTGEGSNGGAIDIDGHPVLGLPSHKVVEKGIALVPEGRGVFGEMTVEENLVLGAWPGRARNDQQANLERIMNLFPKLGQRRSQLVRTMSGGEQQMVAIGRAMMSNPSILMLDEPSLGLSPLLCKELFHSLSEVRKTGLGILLVEQNAKQSLAIADRGYLLENARIIHEDKADALANDPVVQAAYLGGAGGSSKAKPAKKADAETDSKPAKANAPTTGATMMPQGSVGVKPPRQTANALINQDINALVQSAGDAARAQTARVQSATVKPAGNNAAADADWRDDLQSHLDRIGQAAQDALAPSRQAASGQPSALDQLRDENRQRDRQDHLPKIEIWKRPTIEIWRRDDNNSTDGKLIQVKGGTHDKKS